MVKVLITGATGLVGSDLLDILEKENDLENNEVRLLVRNTSNVEGLLKKGFNLYYGDIEDKDSIIKAADGIDIIIHIVQMRYSPTIVDIAHEVGAKRLIIIGTTGIYSQYRLYSSEYKDAEEYIYNNCNVPYVILRPTMIYGSERDKNVHKLVNFMKKFKFFPVFGPGKGKMQPIYYKDLSYAIYQVYKRDNLINESYNIAGKNQLEYQEILRETSKALGQKVFILKIPFKVATTIVSIYNKFSKKPKLKLEQVRRLNEDKVFDYSESSVAFDFNPITFEEGIKKQVNSMYSQKEEL